jgi:type II secretory pathway component PulF
MPQYFFTATDAEGEPQSGRVEADDEAAARDQLRARGLRVLRIEAEVPVDDDSDDSDGDRAADARSLKDRAASFGEAEQPPMPAFSILMADEQQEAFGQLSRMVHHGLPLPVGLRVLAEETSDRRHQRVLMMLSEQVAAGASLDRAVEAIDDELPAWMATVLRAGAKSGRLEGCLEQHVRFSRLRAELRNRMAQTLMYPLVLILLGLAVLGAFGLWIVPQMKGIFIGFNTELPTLTILIIDLSDLLVNFVRNWFITLPAVLIGIPLLWITMRTLLGGSGLRRIVYSIPIFGRTIKLVGLTELCELLAMFVSHRLPMPQALRLTADSLRDPNLKEGLNMAAGRVEAGLLFPRIFSEVPQLPVELRRVTGWDSEDDVLTQSLRVSSELFAMQTDSYSRSLAAALPHVAVLFIGCSTGLLVIALFMPLVKLLNDLS